MKGKNSKLKTIRYRKYDTMSELMMAIIVIRVMKTDRVYTHMTSRTITMAMAGYTVSVRR